MLPCWSWLPSAWGALGSSTAPENTASHKKGLLSLRNLENETAGLKLGGAAPGDVCTKPLIAEERWLWSRCGSPPGPAPGGAGDAGPLEPGEGFGDRNCQARWPLRHGDTLVSAEGG